MSQTLPPQHQDEQPGLQSQMHPEPATTADWYRGSGTVVNG